MTKLKSNFSRYDFVKVRVYLSAEHYYILSRYLVSRVLTAATVIARNLQINREFPR